MEVPMLDLKILTEKANAAEKAAIEKASQGVEPLKERVRNEISIILRDLLTPLAHEGARKRQVSLSTIESLLCDRFEISQMGALPYYRVDDVTDQQFFLISTARNDKSVTWFSIIKEAACDVYLHTMGSPPDGSEYFTYTW